MLRRLFRAWRKDPPDSVAALMTLRSEVERRNISHPVDDRDVGYDMAIDEVLELIDEAINNITSGNDVDYSGGL